MTTTAAAAYARLQDLDMDSMNAQAREILYTVMDDLARALRSTAATPSNAASTRIIRAMLKKAPLQKYARAWIDAQGRQVSTDGARAYRLYCPLDLPMGPDQPKDLEPVYQAIRTRDNVNLGYISQEQVKLFIELERARYGKHHTPIWDLGPDLPSVNAVYLYELLTILPDATLYADRNNIYHPIWATSCHGDAILLPVRKNA